MAKQYRHRIGVRAEICFDMILDAANPTPQQLSHAVAQALSQKAMPDGSFSLVVLTNGVVYPEWNSVDREIEPEHLLDPSVVRSFDVVEVQTLQ